MIPFWVFDLKGDYLHLAEESDTLLINPERFYINPLRHLPLMLNWLERLVEVVVATMQLVISGGELIQIFRFLLRDFQERHGPDKFPSFHEVLLALRELKKRMQMKDRVLTDYVSRLEQRISTLLTSSLGQAFSVYDGYPLEAFINRNLVFDLRNTIREFVSFYVTFLLAWRFEYAINYLPMDGKLRNVIVIDEAEEVLLGNVGVSGIDLITRYIKMFRAAGTGLILSSHSWSVLNKAPVIQNSAGVLVMLGMINSTDALTMARAMGMSGEVAEMIPELVAGEGIVKIIGLEECIPIRIDKVV